VTTLNIMDLVPMIGTFPTDPVTAEPDWSKALATMLQIGRGKGETPLIPNGHLGDPTIIEIPEVLNAVSSIDPYLEGGRHQIGRHIHLGTDRETGFWWKTLGLGNVNAAQSIADAIPDNPNDPASVQAAKVNADAIAVYRGRFGLGPIGGHGWKATMLLRGPKLPGQPWRSPNGTNSKTRNCLEGQAAFRAKDFGKTRSDNEQAVGVLGWHLDDCDIGWWWGDGISPATVAPNDTPCTGLRVVACDLHDLGRMGLLYSQLSDFHVTYCTFGNGIPSDILHAETGSKPGVIIGDGTMDYCVIQSGKRTVHFNGGYELQNLTIDHVARRDKQHSMYFEMGAPLTTGPRAGQHRGRNITMTNCTHDRYIDGERLGVYRNCDGVNHTENYGPISKRYVVKVPAPHLKLADDLFAVGSTNVRLAPNNYRGPKGER
jgi:hypothetical protein